MPYYIPLTKDGLLDIPRATKKPKERTMPRGAKKTEADHIKDMQAAFFGLISKLALLQDKIEKLTGLPANPATVTAPAAQPLTKKAPAARKKTPKATAKTKK